MAELISKDRTNIGWTAKKAMGKLSPLVAMRSVVNLDSDRVRELCAEIYILIDGIFKLIVEKAEDEVICNLELTSWNFSTS